MGLDFLTQLCAEKDPFVHVVLPFQPEIMGIPVPNSSWQHQTEMSHQGAIMGLDIPSQCHKDYDIK